jgi:hypothetical protein
MRLDGVKNVLPTNIASSFYYTLEPVVLDVTPSAGDEHDRKPKGCHCKKHHHLPRFEIDIPPSKKTTSAQAIEAAVFVNSMLNFIFPHFSMLIMELVAQTLPRPQT